MFVEREMDARVAEKVMGWKNCSPRSSYDLPVSGVAFGLGDPPDGWVGSVTSFSRRGVIPPYSTDIRAAREVIEKLRKEGYDVIVRLDATRINPPFAHVEFRSQVDEFVGTAETEELAICLAALKVCAE